MTTHQHIELHRILGMDAGSRKQARQEKEQAGNHLVWNRLFIWSFLLLSVTAFWMGVAIAVIEWRGW